MLNEVVSSNPSTRDFIVDFSCIFVMMFENAQNNKRGRGWPM